MQDTDIVNTDR